MPFYEFGPNGILHNQIESHPSCEFFIYDARVYYNNKPQLIGEHATKNLTLTPPGSVDLYELNVDKVSGSTKDYTTTAEVKAPDVIYPFIYKNGTLTDFKTISYTTVDATTDDVFVYAPYGDILTGSYSLSASITKEYFPINHVSKSAIPIMQGIFGEIPKTREEILVELAQKRPRYLGSKVRALENTLNYYSNLSQHYIYNPEYSLTVGSKVHITHGDGGRWRDSWKDSTEKAINWDKSRDRLGLVSIPSIFYGSSIQKGTVTLRTYITGTLVGELQDKNKNGELWQVGPKGSSGSGSIAGVVLYNEGFVVLTGSWDLTAAGKYGPAHNENYTGSAGMPNWITFAQTIATGTISSPNTSWELKFSGTNYVPVTTMFARAPRGELNYSNNPTFVEHGQATGSATSSFKYVEKNNLKFKNTVSSSYLDPTGSFRKQTFISSIGIYDENKNLIAVAKPATPVKKTEERDLTFKLKLDF